MITAIRKAPATAAGADPSPRIKALRSVGVCSNVQMSKLEEDDIIIIRDIALLIVRIESIGRPTGTRLVMRQLESDVIRSLKYDPASWITQLQIDPALTGAGSHWAVQPGDIVRYPQSPGLWPAAAIRHDHGWRRTSAPWMPLSDLEVTLHLIEGRAHAVRNALHITGAPARSVYPVGTLVACRDARAREPSVWIRTGEDYWVSNSRGATASDLMINYELERGVYHVPYIPEEDR